MTIAHICARETYFTYIDWLSTSLVAEDPIWTCAVTPGVYTVNTHGTRSYVQPTALAHAARCFGYWHGDITYRFKFVVSAYHRGKIGISHEPNVHQSVLIDSNVTLNKQYLKIIDLEDTQDVTVTVKWTAPRMWLGMTTTPDDVICYGGSTFGVPTAADLYNGYIALTPLTALVAPKASDIKILCFVSSSNMKFNYLTDVVMPYERKIVTESGNLSTKVDLNESSSDDSLIGQYHFGEIPTSFRSLLRRYMLSALATATTTAAGTATYYVTYSRNNMPAIVCAYATSPSSTPCTSIYDYLRYGYMGIRGGMKHRFRIHAALTSDMNQQCIVSLNGRATFSANSAANSSTGVYTNMKGTVHFHTNNNGGIEYETPFYSNNMFAFSYNSSLGTAALLPLDDYQDSWVRTHSVTFTTDLTSKLIYCSGDIAAGEDFSFLRFQGAPYFTFVNA